MPLVARVGTADVLTEVLGTLGIAGQVYCRSELSAPWSIAIPSSALAHFHVIEEGEGWIRLDGERAPVPLARGDLVLLPHGGGHVLCDRPETPRVPLARLLPGSPAECLLIRHGGGGAET